MGTAVLIALAIGFLWLFNYAFGRFLDWLFPNAVREDQVDTAGAGQRDSALAAAMEIAHIRYEAERLMREEVHRQDRFP
jgi:hypothetical protein